MYKDALKEYIEIEKAINVECWVKVFFEVSFRSGEKRILKSYELKRDMLQRWLWFINWRRSYYQCQYPREHVFTCYSYYDVKTGLDYGMTSLLDRYISAKAQVTKVQNVINKYIANKKKENDLFYDPDKDEQLIFVNNKLKTKEENLLKMGERIEKQINRIKNMKRVSIRLKNVTNTTENESLLNEISKDTGLKQGDIIETAFYNEKNNSCQFTMRNVIDVDCVAWVGETCEIISE